MAEERSGISDKVKEEDIPLLRYILTVKIKPTAKIAYEKQYS